MADASHVQGERVADSWSQNVTSCAQRIENKLDAFCNKAADRATRRFRGATYRPWAFTEHGALMVANVLRSERAVQMSVFVIRAFVRMREQVAMNQVILKRLAEMDHSLLEHDSALRDIYQKLLPLLQPPPDPPRRRIGFAPPMEGE